MERQSIKWRLEVSAGNGEPAAMASDGASLAVIRGGPITLLRWLETHVGLLAKPVMSASRTLQYAACLDEAKLTVCSQSLQTDRWGTAQALLERRDELFLCGWDGKHNPLLPPLAQELALAEQVKSPLSPGVVERLRAIGAALDSGQKLPAHEITLREGLAAWPAAWKTLINRLSLSNLSVKVEPHGSRGSALSAAQSLLGKTNTKPDDTFLWWSCGSDVMAVEVVASGLESLGKQAADTIVLCEDPMLASLLDARLRRRGGPGMGSSLSSPVHPVLQVLPLALGICWEPVDPVLLLDFLTLPVSPLPRKTARSLAEAVAEQPGIGGRMWNSAISEITENEANLSGDVKKRLSDWLAPSLNRSSGMPPKYLMARCALVAQWAQAYARYLEKNDPVSVLIEPLKALAGEATALSELAASIPNSIAEPQLGKLLAAVRESTVLLTDLPPAAEGPRWVRSLSEIWAPCERLIWLGTHTSEVAASKWSVQENIALKKAGIEADHGEVALRAKREAERSGLRFVKGQLFLIDLAAHRETRLHPIWLQARQAFDGLKPHRLEDLLATGSPSVWPFKTAEHAIVSLRSKPSIWKISPDLLRDRDRTSASEIETRLGCPLKWTFEYAADLRESSVARLPNEWALKGTFSHRILEVVFGNEPQPKSELEVENKVKAACAELLPTEGAPLAQPGVARQRHELELELIRASKIFFAAVSRGGYRVVGFEHEPGGTLLGKGFGGRLDCLLERSSGEKAILDLKYPGIKYREYLEEGTATQLAVYAAAAASDGKGQIEKGTAVGYLLIQRASLLTPEGSAMAGAGGEQVVAGGASVQETWVTLEKALRTADGWLKSGEIPVRPQQLVEDRSEGSAMALKFNQWAQAFEICRYCSYDMLCGRKELS